MKDHKSELTKRMISPKQCDDWKDVKFLSKSTFFFIWFF